jgi:hypothetical protein
VADTLEVLPVADPYPLDIVFVEEVQRTSGQFLHVARQNLPDVGAVDRPVRRQAKAGQPQDGGKEVDAHGRLTGHLACRNSSRPPGHKGHAESPFEALPLAAPQVARTALEPGSVVARDDHECSIGNAESFQGGRYLARAPVEFLDGIAVRAAVGFPGEPLRRKERKMRVFVGHVNEERLVPGALDELDRLLGEQPRVAGLVSADVLDHLVFSSPEGNREVVVGHVEAHEVVEAVFEGMVFRELGEVAQVPLAKGRSAVAGKLQRFRNGDFC